jgi:hypothetical protein
LAKPFTQFPQSKPSKTDRALYRYGSLNSAQPRICRKFFLKDLDMKHAYTVPEFETAYNVGHTKAYEEIGSGRLVSYKVGRNRYISVRAAVDWQHRLEAETNPQLEASARSADPVQAPTMQVEAATCSP